MNSPCRPYSSRRALCVRVSTVYQTSASFSASVSVKCGLCFSLLVTRKFSQNPRKFGSVPSMHANARNIKEIADWSCLSSFVSCPPLWNVFGSRNSPQGETTDFNNYCTIAVDVRFAKSSQMDEIVKSKGSSSRTAPFVSFQRLHICVWFRFLLYCLRRLLKQNSSVKHLCVSVRLSVCMSVCLLMSSIHEIAIWLTIK